MRQLDDSVFDQIAQRRPRRSRYDIAPSVGRVVLIAACGVIVFILMAIFVAYNLINSVALDKSVEFERMGWRFEARYEGVMGISATYSKLTYHGDQVGQSLPRDVNLVTPIGEFVSGQNGWDAAWSDPRVWDDAYRRPDVKDGEPWVRQIESTRDIKEFLAQGFYQAPAEVRRYGVPWTDRQVKNTPADWVYVYRLSWRDRQTDEYSSHAVTGYWVAPERLEDLKWE